VSQGNTIAGAQTRLVGQGNPSSGTVCGAGALYSGPALGGVRSDRLVPFGAVRLGLVGSFGSMLSLHLCLA
jgi:hypothetical protein